MAFERVTNQENQSGISQAPDQEWHAQSRAAYEPNSAWDTAKTVGKLAGGALVPAGIARLGAEIAHDYVDSNTYAFAQYNVRRGLSHLTEMDRMFAGLKDGRPEATAAALTLKRVSSDDFNFADHKTYGDFKPGPYIEDATMQAFANKHGGSALLAEANGLRLPEQALSAIRKSDTAPNMMTELAGMRSDDDPTSQLFGRLNPDSLKPFKGSTITADDMLATAAKYGIPTELRSGKLETAVQAMSFLGKHRGGVAITAGLIGLAATTYFMTRDKT